LFAKPDSLLFATPDSLLIATLESLLLLESLMELIPATSSSPSTFSQNVSLLGCSKGPIGPLPRRFGDGGRGGTATVFEKWVIPTIGMYHFGF
jgi:hypothetical protein